VAREWARLLRQLDRHAPAAHAHTLPAAETPRDEEAAPSEEGGSALTRLAALLRPLLALHRTGSLAVDAHLRSQLRAVEGVAVADGGQPDADAAAACVAEPSHEAGAAAGDSLFSPAPEAVAGAGGCSHAVPLAMRWRGWGRVPAAVAALSLQALRDAAGAREEEEEAPGAAGAARSSAVEVCEGVAWARTWRAMELHAAREGQRGAEGRAVSGELDEPRGSPWRGCDEEADAAVDWTGLARAECARLRVPQPVGKSAGTRTSVGGPSREADAKEPTSERGEPTPAGGKTPRYSPASLASALRDRDPAACAGVSRLEEVAQGYLWRRSMKKLSGTHTLGHQLVRGGRRDAEHEEKTARRGGAVEQEGTAQSKSPESAPGEDDEEGEGADLSRPSDVHRLGAVEGLVLRAREARLRLQRHSG
jgi:hypothetical protein